MDATTGQFHDRLEIQPELIGAQRAAQIVDQPQAALCRLLQRKGKVTVAVTPHLFGNVHCLVGVFEQLLHIVGVIRIESDAYACRYISKLLTQLERLSQPGENFLSDCLDVFAVG